MKKVRTRSYLNELIPCVEGDIVLVPEGTSSYHYYFNNFLEKKEVIDLFSGNEVIATSEYIYDNQYDKILLEKSNFQSDGSVEITRFKYPFDYTNLNANSPYAAALFYMRSGHLLTPIETLLLKKVDNTEYLIDGKMVLNKCFIPSTIPPSLMPFVIKAEKLLTLDLVAPLEVNLFSPSKIVSGELEWDSKYSEKIIFENYDKYGNILGFKKANDVPYCYLFSYDNSFPIAKFSNLTNSEMEATLNSNGFSTASFIEGYFTNEDYLIKFDAIRALFPNNQIETYIYDVLKGVTITSDVNKTNTYFEYDGFGRLVSIKDHNQNILKQFGYHYAGN